MLSYQHEYHAGNHADVLKHAALALCIEALKRKPAPFRVIDAHAGSGIYDLGSPEARKTGEASGGIGRILAADHPPAALVPYLDAIRACHDGAGGQRRYPGSPAVARHLLRPGDQLDLLELHPRSVAILRYNFTNDPQAHVHERDCYEGLPALLPPPERRGLVLLDSAYELRDEFDRVTATLQSCHRRFPGGVYVVWYPMLQRPPADRFARRVVATGIRRIYQVELQVETAGFAGMRGSGLLLVNLPFGVENDLKELLPWLWRTLARNGAGNWRAGWLVPE